MTRSLVHGLDATPPIERLRPTSGRSNLVGCASRSTYAMSDVTDIRDAQGRIDRERQRVTDSLRELAAHLDAAPSAADVRRRPCFRPASSL